MSLNRMQRIILALTLFVIAVMCFCPPWYMSRVSDGWVGTHLGVRYAPVWFDEPDIACYLLRERLFLQLGAVVAVGLVGIIVTGNKQARAADAPRPDADRTDENSNAGQRT